MGSVCKKTTSFEIEIFFIDFDKADEVIDDGIGCLWRMAFGEKGFVIETAFVGFVFQLNGCVF